MIEEPGGREVVPRVGCVRFSRELEFVSAITRSNRVSYFLLGSDLASLEGLSVSLLTQPNFSRRRPDFQDGRMPSLAGDWECTYCSWTNVASVRRCDDCDAPAPAPSPVALTQLPANPAKAEEAPPSSPPPPPAPPPAEESPPKSGAPSSSSPQLSPPPEQEPSYVLDPRYSRTDFAWSARLAEENARVFGAAPLRPEQEQAVNAALDKRDVLVVLPTGFGKSRCYQVPALLEDGLTVLVVPLLSLMTDQWHALNAAGISAQYMNSNQTGAETTQVVRAAPHPPPPPRPHRTVPPPPPAPLPPLRKFWYPSQSGIEIQPSSR